MFRWCVQINLGTNDYSTQPWPTDDEFTAGYNALIADIRQSYAPASPAVVMVCGPMIGDAHCPILQTIASANNATLANINGVLTANDYGCDGHPSVSGHAKMAAAMVPVLQNLLGWE